MKVCVYCSSSSKIDKIYFEATEKLAKEFIEENIHSQNIPLELVKSVLNENLVILDKYF